LANSPALAIALPNAYFISLGIPVVRKNSIRAVFEVNASTYLRSFCPVKREDQQNALLNPTARVPS
jgi:hypothetical protein